MVFSRHDSILNQAGHNVRSCSLTAVATVNINAASKMENIFLLYVTGNQLISVGLFSGHSAEQTLLLIYVYI
jgi:hypothetical protein